MTPKLSLVTGTLDRPESLARLIRSVVEFTAVDWELVISDASEVPHASADPRVRVFHESPRLGCTKGYNAAFRQARGEWCLWLNDDAEVLPGYDTESIEFMEAHPQIGLGALHYSECGGPFHVNSAWGCLYANFGILRRELGEQVGWMDEDCVIMYGNDNTLALRILLANKGVADIPKARLLHHSVKDTVRAQNQKHRIRDNQSLQEKYMPLRRKWLMAYRMNQVSTGTEAWSHGQRPALAR